MVSIFFPRETRTGLTFQPTERQGKVPGFRLDAALRISTGCKHTGKDDLLGKGFFPVCIIYRPRIRNKAFPSRRFLLENTVRRWYTKGNGTVKEPGETTAVALPGGDGKKIPPDEERGFLGKRFFV
jgi:hypothetical protein